MRRKSILVAISLIGMMLIAPSVAFADGSPEDGAVLYADEPPLIEVHATTGTTVDAASCHIYVTGPHGYS